MRNFFEPSAAPAWLRQVLSSVRAALGDIWPAPLRLKDYPTAELPPAADFAQGLAWDSTAGRVTCSNGSAWAQLQPWDSTLAALAALDGTAGLLVQTAPDSFARRSLTAPAAGLTIANPAGTAGNPAFALANDLAALEALSGTNTIYYRSGADAWSAVAIGANLGFSGGTLGSSLGTMATQVANAVAITGGTIAGLTSLGIGITPSSFAFECLGNGAWRSSSGTGPSFRGYTNTTTEVGVLRFGSDGLEIEHSGSSVVKITNTGLAMQGGLSAPGSSPAGGGVLYVQGGALKWRGSSGTVTTIAAA